MGPRILKQEDRLLGKYVLATSLDALTHDADAVLSGYKSRNRVEDRFGNTKSTLKIRPVFLQNDDRIRSLVLVTVIALIVYALIEWVCQQERLASSARQALFMFRMPGLVMSPQHIFAVAVYLETTARFRSSKMPVWKRTASVVAKEGSQFSRGFRQAIRAALPEPGGSISAQGNAHGQRPHLVLLQYVPLSIHDNARGLKDV